MNVAVAFAATATVTVTAKVTFGKMRKRFSVELANEKVSDGCRSKRSKAKWDSEAERQLTAIWADIKTSTVLHGSCADSDGNSERIRLQLRLRQ